MKLRLKTLGVLCLALCRFVLSGRAVKRREVKKVVVFHGGKLGDMICATPVFRAIKEKYPGCAVVVVGSAINKETLEHNPDIESYIVQNGDRVLDTVRLIRRERADFGCILAPGAFGLATLYLSGIPHISAPLLVEGWSPFQTRTYRLLARLVDTREYRKGQYMPRQYLKMLEPIGIFSEVTKKRIFWSEDAEAHTEQVLQENRTSHTFRVGIMPGAGNKIKQWPALRFAEVANYLIETHNAHIYTIGNESNRKEIDTVLSHIEKREYVRDCSSISIDNLKALVSKMHMTVSVDTGPIFIAEASGVPTIDIGGVIHPGDMAPNDGVKHILITYDGEPLLWSLNSRVYDYEKACAGVRSITVGTVIEKINELIERIRSEKSKLTT